MVQFKYSCFDDDQPRCQAQADGQTGSSRFRKSGFAPYQRIGIIILSSKVPSIVCVHIVVF